MFLSDCRCGSAPCIVPVARYSACEIAWHIWEQPAVAVCGVVPVYAIVPIFPSIVHIPALHRERCCTPSVNFLACCIVMVCCIEGLCRGGLSSAVRIVPLPPQFLPLGPFLVHYISTPPPFNMNPPPPSFRSPSIVDDGSNPLPPPL